MVKAITAAEAKLITGAVRKITATYRQATAEQVAEGQAWYPARWAECVDMWPEYPLGAAGVVAAWSPAMTWKRNLTVARATCEAARSGADMPRGMGMGTSEAKAERIAFGGEAVTDVLPMAKKTGRFALAIAGDESQVVVDRWAARVAGFDIEAVPDRLFYLLTEAYVRAARILGVSPRDVQAVTWCVIRGTGE